MSRSNALLRRRGGFTIVEILCSLLVVGICLTILVRLSYWHLQDSASLHRRTMALEYATNVLEELRGRPWEELAGGIDRQEPLPDELAALLRGGLVRVQVTGGVRGFPRCRRLVVLIQWKERGDAAATVRLEDFRHPRRVEAGPDEGDMR